MKLTLVRNATLLLETSGKRILIDPMLDEAGAQPPIEDTENDLRNPLVSLPIPAEDVVAGIDGVVVTHLHEDHFDDRAAELIPPSIPLLTQPGSVDELRERGFSAATDEANGWLGLDVARTEGRHGTGEIEEALAPVTLLWKSSGRWWVFEEPVEAAREVALEAAVRFARGFAVLASTGDVVDRWLVPAAAADQDHVQGAVELAVAASVESVADRLAG
jgi:hypothetical protein